MRKLYIKLYIIFCVFIIYISSIQAYSGQINTNISITLTNNSLSVYNAKIGTQTININWSNTTEIKQNYSWGVDYQYDFSGQNVTIITYNTSYNCSYDCNYTIYFEEMKVKLSEAKFNCSDLYKDAENYKIKYFDCFTNLTICSGYKNTNEDYKIQRDKYESDKNTYYAQNIKLESDYSIINKTYSICVNDRDNYSSQRVLFSFIFAVVGITITYIILRVRPEWQKRAKISKGQTPPSGFVLHPSQVKETSQEGILSLLNQPPQEQPQPPKVI